MITYLKINGFKSFHNFEMEFTPFTVIAGANASGKSNVFDALLLLSRLAETDLKTAFNEQRGSANELFTQYGEDWFADEMEFVLEMLVNPKVKDTWGGEAELKYTRLQYHLRIRRTQDGRGFEDLAVLYEQLEKLSPANDRWMKNYIPAKYRENWRPKVKTGKRGIPYIHTEETNGTISIKIPQDGKQGGKATPANAIQQTVLSGINSVDFPHAFAAKEEMRSWKFLQLNPTDLREPTRQEIGMRDTITQSGKNLASALFRMKNDDQYILKDVSRTLNQFLPNFTDVMVYDDRANKQFIIKLRGEDGREFSSRVLSEGTLRLLTLCIFQYDPQHTGLLCFEEPENGIHPFRITAMAHLLKALSVDFKDIETPLRQVIINTHSPVLVSELIHWEADTSVSIWFSQLASLISEIESPTKQGLQKIKVHISKFLPVQKSDTKPLTLKFSEEECKLTLAEVARYLGTADSGKALGDNQ